MRTFLKRCTVCAAGLLFAGTFCLSGSAAPSTGFTASLLVPENQRNTKGAFDLLVAPGQAQTLQVFIRNTQPEPYRLTVEVRTAGTDSTGQIRFEKDSLFDESLPFRMEEVLTPAFAAIELEPHSETTLDLALQMPDQAFTGQILGNVLITRNATEAEMEKARAAGAAYVDEYALSIGVRLCMGDTQVKPDFALGETAFSQPGGGPTVYTDLHNPTPALLQGVRVENALYPKEGDRPLLSRIIDEANFAPHAVFRIALGDGTDIPAGDYIAVTTVEHEGTVWEFKRELAVPVPLTAIPEQDVPQAESTPRPAASMALLLLGVVSFTIGAVLLAYVLATCVRRQIRKKDYELYRQVLRQKLQVRS